MDLLPQLLTQMAGGGAAAYLDRAKPEWTKHPGADAAKGEPGVAVTPGAVAAVGTALLLALMPGKANSSMWKQVLANLAGGALTYEGATLLVNEVVPRVQDAMKPATPAAGIPGTVTAPMPMTAGIPRYGNNAQGYQLQQALAQYRGAAQQAQYRRAA